PNSSRRNDLGSGRVERWMSEGSIPYIPFPNAAPGLKLVFLVPKSWIGCGSASSSRSAYHGEGMNSMSLRLAVDPSAGKAASALPDDIPFALRQAAVFLGVSPQMMSGEGPECKDHEPSCPA